MEWLVFVPALACAEEIAELREEVARLRAERAFAAQPDEVTHG